MNFSSKEFQKGTFMEGAKNMLVDDKKVTSPIRPQTLTFVREVTDIHKKV